MSSLDIHEVHPAKGGAKGGTLLTVTGTGFWAEVEAVVDIDGIPCVVISHTPNEIRCWTTSPPAGSKVTLDEDSLDGYRFVGQYRG